MNRRTFLRGLALGGAVIAGEMWIPGRKLISIPKLPSFQLYPFFGGDWARDHYSSRWVRVSMVKGVDGWHIETEYITDQEIYESGSELVSIGDKYYAALQESARNTKEEIVRRYFNDDPRRLTDHRT